MTAQSTQLADAAQLLYDAQMRRIPIAPLTQTYPNLDVAGPMRCSGSTSPATSSRAARYWVTRSA